MSTKYEIEIKELLTKLDAGEPLLLVDVRNDDEYENGRSRAGGSSKSRTFLTSTSSRKNTRRSGGSLSTQARSLSSAPKAAPPRWLRRFSVARESRRAI